MCAISRWNSRQTPINGKRFRSKNTTLALHDVSKNYVNTNSHKYVAKTESQQREELQIRTLQTATTCSPTASVPLEQSINTFSEGNVKQTQFHIWQGRVFTLHLSKKTPKIKRKARSLRTSKISVHRNVKSFNENNCKETIPSKIPWNIRSRKVRSQNERNAEKSTSITHQISKKTTAYSIRKSKAFETKISKGVEGVRKFTTNPYKRFRSKQTRLAVHDVSKNYVNTTSHKYVAKTESQQRGDLHTRTIQTDTTCSPSASVPLEQSINAFSEGNIKQT